MHGVPEGWSVSGRACRVEVGEACDASEYAGGGDSGGTGGSLAGRAMALVDAIEKEVKA